MPVPESYQYRLPVLASSSARSAAGASGWLPFQSRMTRSAAWGYGSVIRAHSPTCVLLSHNRGRRGAAPANCTV
jgi:hypothetical protein